MAARRIVISGEVQGVGFRFFCSRTAESLGIRGEVWNRSDGSVEVVAEHSDSSHLSAFENALWTGPGAVQNVTSEELPESFGLDGFRIVSERDS